MTNKNSDTPKAQEQPSIKNAIPSWISVLAIAITALIAGYILLRV